jgi:hypothetical protein
MPEGISLLFAFAFKQTPFDNNNFVKNFDDIFFVDNFDKNVSS